MVICSNREVDDDLYFVFFQQSNQTMLILTREDKSYTVDRSTAGVIKGLYFSQNAMSKKQKYCFTRSNKIQVFRLAWSYFFQKGFGLLGLGHDKLYT